MNWTAKPNKSTDQKKDMRDKLENFVEKHLQEFDTKVPKKEMWTLIENKLDDISNNTDSLEQFIVSNKDSFNNQLPNPSVWSKIDQQLPSTTKVRKINLLRYAGIAASVVLLMLASAATGIYFYGEKNQIVDAIPTPTEIDAEIPAELLEFEKAYKKRVNRRHVQLANYNENMTGSEVLSTVNEDLSKVDEILNDLRNEFKNAPKGSEEQIISAMARNYETKLKILEIVLKRIEKKNDGVSM